MSVLALALACVLALAALIAHLIARAKRSRVNQQTARLSAMSRHPSATPARALEMRMRAHLIARAAGRRGQEPRR